MVHHVARTLSLLFSKQLTSIPGPQIKSPKFLHSFEVGTFLSDTFSYWVCWCSFYLVLLVYLFLCQYNSLNYYRFIRYLILETTFHSLYTLVKKNCDSLFPFRWPWELFDQIPKNSCVLLELQILYKLFFCEYFHLDFIESLHLESLHVFHFFKDSFISLGKVLCVSSSGCHTFLFKLSSRYLLLLWFNSFPVRAPKWLLLLWKKAVVFYLFIF